MQQINDLLDMHIELTDRYPEGYPYTRDGVRLGIAALEDEVAEVYEEWTRNKRHLGNCITSIRAELLQVAAVAMMIIEGIDDSGERVDE